MPASIDESVKRRVIQQWLSGDSRPKIAIDNNIGEGTVGSIINYFKIGLDAAEFNSARELALQAKKQGLNLSDLASNFRLHSFIKTSGVSENQIESFISNISSGELPLEKVIELVNVIHEISKSETLPPDQLQNYVREKYEQKKKIDDDIQQADAVLQSKNVAIEAVNEYLKLSDELDKHGLSTQDIGKLLNLLLNAREYQFDAKKISGKLRGIQRLEKKEKQLRGRCEIFTSRQQSTSVYYRW